VLARTFTWLVRRGLRLAWLRVVQGGNRAWVAVGGVALLGHLAGRALSRRERTVIRERIAPGEVFSVTHSARD
jgi:hypothetical protein